VKTWLIYSVAWLAICGLLGVLGLKFLGISFWMGFCIAAVALLLNGLIAEFEDRSPGGLLHSGDDKKPPSKEG
jgi:asparagine N-glycosylation enzyme membrane subunit Stt3